MNAELAAAEKLARSEARKKEAVATCDLATVLIGTPIAGGALPGLGSIRIRRSRAGRTCRFRR